MVFSVKNEQQRILKKKENTKELITETFYFPSITSNPFPYCILCQEIDASVEKNGMIASYNC